jgi:uncharacterized protein
MSLRVLQALLLFLLCTPALCEEIKYLRSVSFDCEYIDQTICDNTDLLGRLKQLESLYTRGVAGVDAKAKEEIDLHLIRWVNRYKRKQPCQGLSKTMRQCLQDMLDYRLHIFKATLESGNKPMDNAENKPSPQDALDEACKLIENTGQITGDRLTGQNTGAGSLKIQPIKESEAAYFDIDNDDVPDYINKVKGSKKPGHEFHAITSNVLAIGYDHRYINVTAHLHDFYLVSNNLSNFLLTVDTDGFPTQLTHYSECNISSCIYSQSAQPAVATDNSQQKVCTEFLAADYSIKSHMSDISHGLTSEKYAGYSLAPLTGNMEYAKLIRVGRGSRVDFNNDGNPDNLVDLSYFMHDKNCEHQFYDLLKPELNHIQLGDVRDVLLKMQGSKAHADVPFFIEAAENNCRRATWLSYGNKIYLEVIQDTQAKKNDDPIAFFLGDRDKDRENAHNFSHKIYKLENNALNGVCDFKNVYKVRISNHFHQNLLL